MTSEVKNGFPLSSPVGSEFDSCCILSSIILCTLWCPLVFVGKLDEGVREKGILYSMW